MRSLFVSFAISFSLAFSGDAVPQPDVQQQRIKSTGTDAGTILHSLGVPARPNARQMNVSQEEYSNKMNMFLKRTKRSVMESRQLFSFRPEKVERLNSGELLLVFRHVDFDESDGATLKMLVSGASKVDVYQRNGDGGQEALINSKELSPPGAPIWIDSYLVPQNVESANVNRSETNLIFRVSCGSDCQVFEPVVNAVRSVGAGRRKRQVPDPVGRTDCTAGDNRRPDSEGESNGKPQRPRCCRNKMDVVFKDLPGYEYIVAPYSYDLGICRGGCPFAFNPGTLHSTIQSLMNRRGKGNITRPCCAPSKLEPFQILQLDEADPKQLVTITWDESLVVECACF